MKIQQFYLNKNKFKKTDMQPGYEAKIKDENGQWIKIAAAWVGKDTEGNTSISVKLSDGVFLEGTPTYTPKPKVELGEVDEPSL